MIIDYTILHYTILTSIFKCRCLTYGNIITSHNISHNITLVHCCIEGLKAKASQSQKLLFFVIYSNSDSYSNSY